ncbi:hypothetical protein [Leifsonia sp. NPDC058230]|uniref:hypothetical protein n=1 Tax=Leifsonia sp. NPDC058230 TaxID=3346391 RepID=UPI0036DDAD05
MVIKAGLAPDENGIAAVDLNQTHIGLPFGTNFDDGTVAYARIAAIFIKPDHVEIHLDGVSAGEDYSMMHFDHHEKLYFTRYSMESQTRELLEEIRDNTA